LNIRAGRGKPVELHEPYAAPGTSGAINATDVRRG
jgi:hypothetical protein